MEYRIVETFEIATCLLEVNKLLKDGWQLQGGIATNFNRSYARTVYAQAMVKK